MQGRKNLYLFIALLLPICVFIFLKMFGKNEFAVAPLFVDVMPEIQPGCTAVTIPYHTPDSIVQKLDFKNDSLVLISFGEPNQEGVNQLKRVDEQHQTDRVHQLHIPSSDYRYTTWKNCIFFLKEPFDLVLVDRKGVIRGQYTSNDLDEMDRLITEITIILKKY